MDLRLSTQLQGESRTWTLEQSPARVGRSSTNTIQLLDGTVSKEHAEFSRDGDGWRVRDLGSRNGTRVNGVDAGDGRAVALGDSIEIGHVVLRADTPESSETIFRAGREVGSSLKMRATDLLQSGAATTDSGKMMQLLSEAGRLLVLPRPQRETCEALLAFVERAVPANRLVMLLKDKESGQLVQVAARAKGMSLTEPLSLSQSIVRSVLEDNSAVITGDAASDPRFVGHHSIVAQAIHSAMAVPLWDNQDVLGILYADSTVATAIYNQGHLEMLTLLANMAAVKITNSRLLEAEQTRQRMAQELATATRIQQNLLPEAPRDLPGWQFHARIETCHEVGGDLYDFHRCEDGRLVLLVGDVSGKGMGAALLMSSVLSAARVLYDTCPDPVEFVSRLNAAAVRSSDSRSFVTLFVGWLDLASGHLRYVNAGHPHPHLVLVAGTRLLESTGIPIGMIPNFEWEMGEAVIETGATLAVFSDGIPEAQRGQEFFDDARVADTICAAAIAPNVDVGADLVIAAVDAFVADSHRSDDVTLMLVRRT